MQSKRSVDASSLDDLFERLLPEAEQLIAEDENHRCESLLIPILLHKPYKSSTVVSPDILLRSPALDVEITNECTRVRLTKDKKGIHVIQLQRPLTPDESYFSVSLKKSGMFSRFFLLNF
jgi:hypothetical protein